MSAQPDFDRYFSGRARERLLRAVDLALDEDGRDLATRAIFPPSARLTGQITAKAGFLLAGLPMAAVVLERLTVLSPEDERAPWKVIPLAAEGERLERGRPVCRIESSAWTLLKAERVILNFMARMSGVATATAACVAALKESRTRLLDTRKTLPGLRWPDKYAVRVGGGFNHRMDLEEMLMLKDNHVDACGDVQGAVRLLRERLAPCPPIEVECRTLAEVDVAVAAGVNRIMLDNMDVETMRLALARVPKPIETEISGNVTLERLPELGRLGADYVSMGAITHSAPAADMSLKVV